MSKSPLVSVIMSEFNTDVQLLKDSIESILNQDYENLELIIIDDCGKNNLNKIKFLFNNDRLKIYKNTENLGLVQSLNRAIELSKGKYIARMDTDDYSYSNRIRLQVEFLEKNPQFSLVGSRVDKYDGEKIWGETCFYGEVTREKLLRGNPLTHPSVMFKSELMKNNGGYLNYTRCEDYATWINLFVNGYRFYVMEEKLLRYHLSLEDYKKRTLKTRKGFFCMIRKEYIKLKPTLFQIVNIYIRNIIAGVLPWRLIHYYHRKKNKIYEKN